MVDYLKNIISSGLTIYDETALYDKSLYIPNETLETLLNHGLVGLNLAGLPLRTRSKFVKALICKARGYPVPETFQKTKPSFPGQNFDAYTQKSMNLQIWNEEINPARRYAIIQVDSSDKILKVKVISGAILISLDRTGTLTTKYQAMLPQLNAGCLFSESDTKSVHEWCGTNKIDLSNIKPTSAPMREKLLPISTIYNRLKPLEGYSMSRLDSLQERNRGAILHKLICEKIGFTEYEDNGAYPDIPNQLIEIKLQTSPTIDLGLHSPNGHESIYTGARKQFFSNDIRYAIMSGIVKENSVIIKNLYMVTGEEFTRFIPLFGGNVQNSKLQIPLPSNFFY
jgi:hypothetical protein